MPIRHLAGALLLGFLLCGMGVGAARAQTDVFTVGNVKVDATAATAAAARETAHAEGHVQAMQKLLTRLLPRDELARMRPLEYAEIVEYVKDFDVADERTSDVRYLANLTFRFKADAVRALLRTAGLVFAETQSKPVLVVAVYGPAGDAVLWEDTNVWSQAWAVRRQGEGLVPLLVPLGDLGDVTTVDAAQALAGDRTRLSALAQRYVATDVLVTQAVLQGDPDAGDASLQVSSSRLGTQQLQTMLGTYAQQPGESLPALLARVAEAVDGDVQEAWKQRNLLRPGAQSRLVVSVPVAALADWLEVRRRLSRVAAVQRSEVTLLSRKRTEVQLTFVGDEQQLILALAQSDLALVLNPVSGWQLSPSDAAAPEVRTEGIGPEIIAPSPAGGSAAVPEADGQTVSPIAPPTVE